MTSYQVENWSDCLPELQKLFPEHYEELSSIPTAKRELDYDAYSLLEKAKILKLFTCRSKGELVGYAVFLVKGLLHYKNFIQAQEDMYYLKKEYRKGFVGIKLFKFVEEELKKMGAQRIVLSTKIYSDNSKLFEYLGYEGFSKMYQKIF